MENMLLVGLSRQMTLERQMDVVANNVANVNTNATRPTDAVFRVSELGAHEDNFKGRDRAVSYVLDNGTFKDFYARPDRADQNPLDVAIDGGGFLVVQTQPASATPATAACRSTTRASCDRRGDPVLGTSARSCSSRPTMTSTLPPTAMSPSSSTGHTVTRSAASLRLVSFAQAQRLLKEGSNL